MCGRYTLTTPLDELVEVFDVPPVEFDYAARYNIAPTQEAPVLAADGRGARMGLLRWGLVPFWADDPSVGSRLINARAETLLVKPAFKYSVRARRCLVPADGFYEWTKEGDRKVPYWIHSPDRGPLSLAGLWERWEGKEQEPVYSFAIITVDANERVRPLHDRMPAIVRPEDRHVWIDKGVPCEDAMALLKPYEGELNAHAVSTLVNSPANDVPDCIEPVTDA